MENTILVTGGTGLVGSHLLFDLVSKGRTVRALRRKGSNVQEVQKIFSRYSEKSAELLSKIEWVEGDILDPFSLSDAMQGINRIYHCAAIVSMNSADGASMIRNNVTGTANLVNLALENKIEKFCHVSSVAALGIEHGKEITEETPWNDESNGSAYAISKYLAENEVWRASQEGLNVVIVNPTIVIGPCNPHRSSGLLFKAARQGLRWYSAGGMGYVDARDVAKAMILLMESSIINQKMIVSSENLPYRKFTELMYQALKQPLPNKKAGPLLLSLAWRLDKLKSRLTGSDHIFTREVANYAGVKLAYSNIKAKRTLQMDFIPVEKAVQDAAKHFISQDLKRQN